MLLSDHFSLEELTRSWTAAKYNINNNPGPEELKNLQILCLQVLEPTRKSMGGYPITINSGYRCKALNALVGGSPNSYHIQGKAADIAVSSYDYAKKLANALNKCPLTDIVLIEIAKSSIWVHCQISFVNPRHKINYGYHPGK